MPKDLRIYVTPYCMIHSRNREVKHWLGWFTHNYDPSKEWKYEIAINSERFFLFQIITFIHELGHYICAKYGITWKVGMIIERTTLPIYYPEKLKGIYFKLS